MSTRKKWFVLYLERVSRRREVEALGERTVHGAPRTGGASSDRDDASDEQRKPTKSKTYRPRSSSFATLDVVLGAALSYKAMWRSPKFV